MTAAGSVLVFGIVVGSVYGIAALGLVLTYRISGVFNFGHGAVAMFAAYAYFQIHDRWGVPGGFAVIIVVGVLAPLAGWTMDRAIFRPLAGRPVVVRVVASTAIFIVLVSSAGEIWKGAGRSITPVFPRRPVRLPAGIVITTEQIGILACAIAASAAVYAVLRFTTLGVRLRAVVDDRDLASLWEIDAGRTSTVAWAIGTALAALSGILIAPLVTLDTYTLPLLVVAAYAAAVIAYLRSLPGTLAAAAALGVADQAIALHAPSATLLGLRPSLPFISLFFVLVVRSFVIPKLKGRAPQVAAEGPALAGPRPAPMSPRGRLLAGALTAAAMLAPPLLSARNRFLLAAAAVNALLALSIVLVTGYSGQLSLGHFTFAAGGAFALAHLARTMPFLPALLLAALLVVPIGAALAVLASRLLGLYLALGTLAFALMADQLFSNILWLTGGPSGLRVPRPWDASDLAFCYIAFAVLACALPAARNLVNGRTGRILAAMRDSETASKTIGIDLFRAKVLVFSMSAFLAGLAGALSASLSRVAVMSNFNPIASIAFLAVVVLCGVTRPAGAVLAGLLFSFGQAKLGGASGLLFGLAAIGLVRNPQGILSFGRGLLPSGWMERAVLRYRGEIAPTAEL